MKKRLLLISMLCLLISSLTMAQRNRDKSNVPKVKVKETISKVSKTVGSSLSDVYPSASGGYWSIGAKYLGGRFVLYGIRGKSRNGYFVQSYDENLNLIEEKPLSLKVGGKFLDLHSIKKVGREYYIFLTFENDVKKKKYLFYALFDPAELKIDGDVFKMAEAKLGGKGYTYPSFDVQESKDKKFLVVFGKDSKKVKRTRFFNQLFSRKSANSSGIGTHQFKFSFWVFDNKMKTINYQKNYKMEIENSSDKFYVRDYSVDESGAVYILGKNVVVDNLSALERRKKKSKVWKEYEKSAFVLERVMPDGTKDQYVTPEDILYIDMAILFNQGKDLQLVGITGEQYFNGLLCTGVSRLILDNELYEINENSSKFDDEVLENVNDVQAYEKSLKGRRKKKYDKKKERKEKRMTEEDKKYAELRKRAALNVKSIEYAGLDENGDATVVLEEQYLRVVTTTTRDANGNTTTTTTYYYHYEDLIFCKFIDDEVMQNFFKKSYVSVNYELPKSLDARALSEGDLEIVTQQEILFADEDFKLRAAGVKAFERKNKIAEMGRYHISVRKITEDGQILLAAQRKKKLAWIKINPWK